MKAYSQEHGGTQPMVTPLEYKMDVFKHEHKLTQINILTKFLLRFRPRKKLIVREIIDNTLSVALIECKTLADKKFILKTNIDFIRLD